jgi:hypothetical protein
MDSTTPVLLKLLDSDVLVPVIAGAVVALVVISKSIASVLRTSARERSRREIAAYIAEGSMTPEQGEKLMKSGDREQA